MQQVVDLITDLTGVDLAMIAELDSSGTMLHVQAISPAPAAGESLPMWRWSAWQFLLGEADPVSRSTLLYGPPSTQPLDPAKLLASVEAGPDSGPLTPLLVMPLGEAGSPVALLIVQGSTNPGWSAAHVAQQIELLSSILDVTAAAPLDSPPVSAPPLALRAAELEKTNTLLNQELEKYKRAEKELRQRNRELMSLQASVAATASTLDLQFVLQTVTWEMSNLVEVDGCAIYEYDEEANEVRRLAQYSATMPPEARSDEVTFSLADYPLHRLVLTERYTRQFTQSTTGVPQSEHDYIVRQGIQSLLILPMIFQDRVVGLVELKDYTAERAFSDREISLAQLLATHAASAMENATLYERARLEISRREEAEKQIRASLAEKEVLLKEIHHRVKNNLQIISSLLSLQTNYISEPKALEAFQDGQNRVRSMALIHEKLYRSADIAQIELSDYIRSLGAYLIQSYRAGQSPVQFKVVSDDVVVAIEKAVPCGLIINELLSNSLKHGFPADWVGEGPPQITVKLRRAANQHVELIIADNGTGLPPEFDFTQTDSLGLQIVNTLVSQLDGTIKAESDQGTCVTVTFEADPPQHDAERVST